ncbi:hypothetical protein ANCDUO_27337 [Ancylostoma duodenale]|uniref:Uncharacterized protein n=1 Tax=Ancylostoma duodenale TaxID=51022 RepID=A0A0C2FCA6_9BILA|nr:hypothetical protein ANCDUO_27337 [Ancylostoma duodenale]
MTAGEIYFSTCARMDSKMFGGVARTACNTACKAKNCRRGVCEKLTGRTRCECIFCGDGKSFPLDVLVNLVGGALLKKG